MLMVMNVEKVRSLMPNKNLEDLLRLITSGIAERAKKGCYSQTVGCPQGIYSEERLHRQKNFWKNWAISFDIIMIVMMFGFM